VSFRRSDLAYRLSVEPAALQAQFDSPVLVWDSPSESTEAAWERTSSLPTTSDPHVAEALVFRVTKAEGAPNPFPMGITVGRVETNDIVIDQPSVSRFHAWLQQDPRTGSWEMRDADSKNGTFVNERRVAAKDRKVLASGDRVRLGDVELRFLLPAELFAWLGGA